MTSLTSGCLVITMGSRITRETYGALASMASIVYAGGGGERLRFNTDRATFPNVMNKNGEKREPIRARNRMKKVVVRPSLT